MRLCSPSFDLVFAKNGIFQLKPAKGNHEQKDVIELKLAPRTESLLPSRTNLHHNLSVHDVRIFDPTPTKLPLKGIVELSGYRILVYCFAVFQFVLITFNIHPNPRLKMSYTASGKTAIAGSSSRPSHGHGPDGDGTLCAWDRLNVLTFDGGGVKGYYSLLQLQKLMEFIGIAEREYDEGRPVYSETSRLTSFAPCGEQRYASHLPKYTPFLPCHYFDYIAGTSTGALITIMLARLRMPVEDCLAEYNQFGECVFGRPRILHQVGKRGFVFKKTKFKTANLEEAIKDVIRRRGEVGNDHDDALPFTTPKGLCRALVLVNIDYLVPSQKDSIFLFRSYDHFHSRSGDKSSEVRDRETEHGPRNPGSGTRFAAWKVGRAATAAKLYFEPLVVVKDDGDIVRKKTIRTKTNIKRPSITSPEPSTLSRRMSSGRQMPILPATTFKPPSTIHMTDAGYGRTNNPSEEVLRELRCLLANRNKKIETWVSVGTARSSSGNSTDRRRLTFTTESVIAEGLKNLGDTEPAHRYMDREAIAEGFNYVRLNEAGGLDIEMDEWKTSKGKTDTLEAIRVSFNNWAAKTESVEMFQKCARALVHNRRERAENMPRWERYALGNFYVCGEKNCSYDCDKTWDYRDEFENHLRTHGIENEERLREMTTKCEQHWDYKPPPRSDGTLG